MFCEKRKFDHPKQQRFYLVLLLSELVCCFVLINLGPLCLAKPITLIKPNDLLLYLVDNAANAGAAPVAAPMAIPVEKSFKQKPSLQQQHEKTRLPRPENIAIHQNSVQADSLIQLEQRQIESKIDRLSQDREIFIKERKKLKPLTEVPLTGINSQPYFSVLLIAVMAVILFFIVFMFAQQRDDNQIDNETREVSDIKHKSMGSRLFLLRRCLRFHHGTGVPYPRSDAIDVDNKNLKNNLQQKPQQQPLQQPQQQPQRELNNLSTSSEISTFSAALPSDCCNQLMMSTCGFSVEFQGRIGEVEKVHTEHSFQPNILTDNQSKLMIQS